jgi:DnaJ-class molecular chaperone
MGVNLIDYAEAVMNELDEAIEELSMADNVVAFCRHCLGSREEPDRSGRACTKCAGTGIENQLPLFPPEDGLKAPAV